MHEYLKNIYKAYQGIFSAEDFQKWSVTTEFQSVYFQGTYDLP